VASNTPGPPASARWAVHPAAQPSVTHPLSGSSDGPFRSRTGLILAAATRHGRNGSPGDGRPAAPSCSTQTTKDSTYKCTIG
jgi:hypothetical protein